MPSFQLPCLELISDRFFSCVFIFLIFFWYSTVQFDILKKKRPCVKPNRHDFFVPVSSVTFIHSIFFNTKNKN